MRRVLCGVVSAAFVSFTFWACSGGSSPTSPAPTPSANVSIGTFTVRADGSATETYNGSLQVRETAGVGVTVSRLLFTGDNGYRGVFTPSGTGKVAANGTLTFTFTDTSDGAPASQVTAVVSYTDDNAHTGSATGSTTVTRVAPPAATYALVGFVRDQRTSQAIVNATVAIADGPNANKSASTSSTGYYAIAPLTAGSFTIHVTASGYNAADVSVTLNANTQKDATLQSTAPAPAPPPPPPPPPGPIAAPGLPSRAQVGPNTYRCSLDAIVHPASCVNNMFGNATALCIDGARSCSANNSGTCSGHTGVYCWVCPGPLCP
jgi:hypothetical protein